MAYFAHSLEGVDETEWEALCDHLERVAAYAAARGDALGLAGWASLAGQLHDIGKSSADFQARLRGSPTAADHSTAGAQLAVRRWGPLGRVLAYAIAGHHSGLADTGELAGRLAKTDVPAYDPDIVDLPDAAPPIPFSAPGSMLAGSLFVRMVFACLVDADFVATETFYDPAKSAARGRTIPLDDLIARLERALADKAAGAKHTPINRERRAIQDACRRAADAPTGVASLTVPTGGGKTLASLLFALHHARAHGLRRVIYVIPYTSIIEQTAQVFREILGPEAVLEHHSGYPAPDAGDAEGVQAYAKMRLDAENWDAPVVVTTNVQFFESLFAAKPAQCRKLQAVGGSVVVLDEAQMLPTAYLKPCIEVLKELAANYRVTPLLCTATQPALRASDWLSGGFADVREIAPDPEGLHARFRRVTVEREGPMADTDLADALSGQRQALCIVDTRGHAAALFDLLRDRTGADGSYHLSARMCPAHRRDALANVRMALKTDAPCRVVSTQVIEAGVDVDFPAVYRALAGLDSLAQAAGRCNREQRRERGTLHVFETDWAVKLPDWQRRIACARAVLDSGADPLSPAAQQAFFQQLYDLEDLDPRGIVRTLADPGGELAFDFRAAAAAFRFIDSAMEPVIVPYDAAARARIAELRASPVPGRLARRLDPYTVQVHPHELAALRAAGAVEPVGESFQVLVNADLYDESLGLCPEEPTYRDPAGLVW